MAAHQLNDAHLPKPWQAPCGRRQICRHAIGQGVLWFLFAFSDGELHFDLDQLQNYRRIFHRETS